LVERPAKREGRQFESGLPLFNGFFSLEKFNFLFVILLLYV